MTQGYWAAHKEYMEMVDRQIADLEGYLRRPKGTTTGKINPLWLELFQGNFNDKGGVMNKPDMLNDLLNEISGLSAEDQFTHTDYFIKCPMCGGLGLKQNPNRMQRTDKPIELVTCEHCNGSKKVPYNVKDLVKLFRNWF